MTLDANGNPGLVAPGELIESAWGNSVASRVTLRFPNKAALDATSAAEGTLAFTTDTGTVWVVYGATWRPTAVGNRIGFRLLGGAPGQNITPLTDTVCTWRTEESDPSGVVTLAGTFTVPAGWAGRWMFEWAIEFDAPSSGARRAWLSTGGRRLGQISEMTEDSAVKINLAGAASAVLAVGGTVSVMMYHSSPTFLACNVNADQYFQGYYVGPI